MNPRSLSLIFGLVLQASLSVSEDPLENKYGKLQHASVIMRHGDRGPYQEYPLDPHINYPWPQGLGQLTKIGKMRMFQLGEWFKPRYGNLTGKSYSREKILVQSSDVDRTIMSALLFLRGFYPANTESDQWNNFEQWQPIPVHVIPQEYDNLILWSRKCPRMESVFQVCYDVPKYDDVFNEYKDTIDFIGLQTGFNFTNAIRTQIVGYLDVLHDVLFVDTENNLTLPEWANQVYPEPLTTILKKTMYTEHYCMANNRLTLGPLLTSITSDMVRKRDDQNFKQVLHIYSGHDSTILGILLALGIAGGLEKLEPPYGTTLMFELRRNRTKDLVTVTYKSTTHGSPKLLEIPACGKACTLEQFLEVLEPLIPDDWDRECVLPSASITIGPNYVLILVTFVYFLSK